jgi:Spy/CpxP family protein refolding chaperone
MSTTTEDEIMHRKGTLRTLTLIAAVVLIGMAGWTVLATNENLEPQAGDSRGGFLRHLHELGHRMHGSGHSHDPMAGLIEELELTPDQQQRLENVHRIIDSYGAGRTGSMVELHERLVQQFQEGRIEPEEVRAVIDEHVEQLRGMAYSVTDELLTLVNELDESQRRVMLEHLQAGHGGHRLHDR